MVFNSEKTLQAIESSKNLPGVMRAEPFRSEPVVLKNGSREKRLSITGKPPVNELSRVMDADLKPVKIPETPAEPATVK